jgi:GT2 family glycosyltransferase
VAPRPLLSICIPTWNRPDRVASLAREVSSWGSDVEVLVGDDASTSTLKANLPPYVKYIWDGSRHGQYQNTNRCIAAASGEWVVALNDDDTLSPAILELLRSARADSVLVTGTTSWSGAGAEEVELVHSAKLRSLDLPGTLTPPDTVPQVLKFGNPFICSHTAFRRTLAVQLGGFDPQLKYVGDYDLWLRLARHGAVTIGDVLVGDYFIHEGSHSAQKVGRLDWSLEYPCVIARAWRREGRSIPRDLRYSLAKVIARSLVERHRVSWALRNAGPLLVS